MLCVLHIQWWDGNAGRPASKSQLFTLKQASLKYVKRFLLHNFPLYNATVGAVFASRSCRSYMEECWTIPTSGKEA